jgi:hypothetical protein
MSCSLTVSESWTLSKIPDRERRGGVGPQLPEPVLVRGRGRVLQSDSRESASLCPSHAAWIGVMRWCPSWRRWTSKPTFSRTVANSSGTTERYFSVDHRSSIGHSFEAGS